MMEHTPGPWEAVELLPDGLIVTVKGTFEIRTPEYDVATIVPGGGPFRIEDDAILAAAVPELLEACRIAVETFDDDAPGPGDTEKGALRRLRAAIFKAEWKDPKIGPVAKGEGKG